MTTVGKRRSKGLGLPVPGLPVPGLTVPGLTVPGLTVPDQLARCQQRRERGCELFC